MAHVARKIEERRRPSDPRGSRRETAEKRGLLPAGTRLAIRGGRWTDGFVTLARM